MVHKSGYVALVGAPNVGKSTLLNRLLGEKVAITSPKPQTTRTRITGILNLPEAQLIFLDTPGIHQPKGRLNQTMVRAALASLAEAEAVVLITDTLPRALEEARVVCEHLSKVNRPVVLALNKIDLINKVNLLPLIDSYQKMLPFRAIVPISALNGDGVEALLAEILELIPEGPRYFPEDIITDQPERVICAEIIREKIFTLTSKEIPYASVVMVDEFKEKPGLILIRATIFVERPSQKGILIGRGGSMLKRLGQAARVELETFLASKVHLELWVKVKKDWRRDERALKEFGLK